MIRKLSFVICFYLTVILTLSQAQEIIPERQWPQYRGYRGCGILDKAGLPLEWNVKTRENIRWIYEVPGLGLSSPVIWGDRLFITTAVSEKDNEGLKTGIYGSIGSINDESEHEWKVLCLDKNTGEILWERIACRGVPEQKRHPKSSHANSSVATNGTYVTAFFGSEGLYCYTMDGDLLWEKDFGVLRSVFFRAESAEWEFASSPVIHKNRLIIQCDVMENSFIAAFDVYTGQEIWKRPRDEYPGWCTPNIYEDNGRTSIVVNGYKHIGGYDFQSGEEIWKMSGGGDIPIPTPIIGDNLIYINSAHGPSSPIIAVKKNARGAIPMEPGKFIEWYHPRGGAYMQTMLLYNDLLYILKWNGTVQCLDAYTGQEIYNEKLGRSDSFTASPVASDGRIFAVSDEGKVYIIKAGKNFEVLTEQSLDDISMVTPAITEEIIYFRTQSHLIAVGDQ